MRKEKSYKTIAKDKDTNIYKIIEMSYCSKKDFIKDLRANGYAVNPTKVKRTEVFNYIMDKTNCYPWDWTQYNIKNIK